MNPSVRIQLDPSPSQAQRLAELQAAFSDACNLLAPLVAKCRCWNRVALHHLAYKVLREAFPGLGSQMVCNAIYSVSRTCRVIYQHPKSPFHIARMGDRPLPRLHFKRNSPVYFDRHTLSIKDGQASMFTLDGRMRFRIELTPEVEGRFRADRLREIVLTSRGDIFHLNFLFADPLAGDTPKKRLQAEEGFEALSEHVLINHTPELTTPPATVALPAAPHLAMNANPL